MATTLIERILSRFQNVPGVTAVEANAWLTEAKAESELIEGDAANTDNALVYLSSAIGYENMSADASRFFSYKDGDESVDKTNIFENYMKLAKEYRRNYRKARRGGGAFQTHTKRADER